MQFSIASLAIIAGFAEAFPKRQAASVSFTDTVSFSLLEPANLKLTNEQYDALKAGNSVGLLHGLEYVGAKVKVGTQLSLVRSGSERRIIARPPTERYRACRAT